MDQTSQRRLKRARILLAEDDPGDQELTRRALHSEIHSDELHIVQDGMEALDYLFRRDKYEDPATSPWPDLILLDLNMPRLNGRQVLAELRKHPHLDRIPVVVLTTSNHEQDVTHCYSLGCNSFISKPFAIAPFLAAIQDLRHYWFELVALPPKQNATL